VGLILGLVSPFECRLGPISGLVRPHIYRLRGGAPPKEFTTGRMKIVSVVVVHFNLAYFDLGMGEDNSRHPPLTFT
jgi:hypothetical protein